MTEAWETALSISINFYPFKTKIKLREECLSYQILTISLPLLSCVNLRIARISTLGHFNASFRSKLSEVRLRSRNRSDTTASMSKFVFQKRVSGEVNGSQMK